MEEIWKPIKGYEHLYEISNLGKVKSIKRKSEIKHVDDGTGYRILALWKENKQKMKRVHTLVGEHFVENPNPNLFNKVCHLDNIRDNNIYTNLYWGNDITNTEDKMKANRQAKGFDLPQTKLSIEQKEEIIILSKTISQSELGRRYGVSQQQISRIINKPKKAVGVAVRDYE